MSVFAFMGAGGVYFPNEDFSPNNGSIKEQLEISLMIKETTYIIHSE